MLNAHRHILQIRTTITPIREAGLYCLLECSIGFLQLTLFFALLSAFLHFWVLLSLPPADHYECRDKARDHYGAAAL